MMVPGLPRTVIAEAHEPTIGRLMGREMHGQQPPRTTAAQHVENRVHHLTHRPSATTTSLGRRRHAGREDLPFRVGKVAAISQMIAIMSRTGLGRPHSKGPTETENEKFPSDSIHFPNFKTRQRVSRQTLRAWDGQTAQKIESTMIAPIHNSSARPFTTPTRTDSRNRSGRRPA